MKKPLWSGRILEKRRRRREEEMEEEEEGHE
jgi:hypothetical protein